MYTAGTVAEVPNSILSSTRTLSVHMYALSSEGLYTDQAYATAVVLLIIVLLINWLSGALAKKSEERIKTWISLRFQIWIYIMMIFMP